MSEARQSPSGPGKEPLDGDLSYRAILNFTIGLTVLIAASAALMWFLTVGLRDRVAAQDPPPPVLPEARMRYEPPAPRLQASPEEELAAMQAEDEAALAEYAWVDEAGGIARVPVERAMELLVARGRASMGGDAAAASVLPGTGVAAAGEAAMAPAGATGATGATAAGEAAEGES